MQEAATPARLNPEVLSFDEFAAREGAAPFTADHGTLRYPNGISKSERRRNDKRTAERLRASATATSLARARYDHLLEIGAIRPPTSLEALSRTAQGHEDNPSVQAARRLLERRAARLAAAATPEPSIP